MAPVWLLLHGNRLWHPSLVHAWHPAVSYLVRMNESSASCVQQAARLWHPQEMPLSHANTHEGLVSDLKPRFTPGTLQSHYLSKIEATGADAADFV